MSVLEDREPTIGIGRLRFAAVPDVGKSEMSEDAGTGPLRGYCCSYTIQALLLLPRNSGQHRGQLWLKQTLHDPVKLLSKS